MSLREVKIKTGILRRITNDFLFYKEEASSQEDKVNELIASEADEHDIKKQREVLEETVQMIPDNLRRLSAAYKDLQKILTDLTAIDPKLESNEVFIEAKNLLAQPIKFHVEAEIEESHGPLIYT